MSWKQDIAAHDARLKQIVHEISTLDTPPISPHAEQAEILRSRFAIVAASAPWRRLPVELLEDVFVLANESDEGYIIPTTLSCVCSEWRARALEMHRLWTRIRILNSRGHRTAHIWFCRSKPTLVRVNCSMDEEITPRAAFFSALHLINHHLERLTDLTIEVGGSQAVQDVTECLTSPAPNLRLFELIGQAAPPLDDDDEIKGAPRLFHGQAPKLQTLQIMSPHSPWPSGLTQTLTELIILAPMDDTPGHLWDFIENIPSLSRLTIQECDLFEWIFFLDDYVRMITLPLLTYAKLEGFTLGSLGLVLQYMVLPKLHTLQLEYRVTGDPELVPDFIAPPFSSLCILGVTRIDEKQEVDEMEYLAEIQYFPLILRRCANVEVLRTNTVIVFRTLIGDLSTPGGIGYPLCPRLVRLRLEYADFKVDVGLLHQFLQSRGNERKVASIGVLSLDDALAVTGIQPFSGLNQHLI